MSNHRRSVRRSATEATMLVAAWLLMVPPHREVGLGRVQFDAKAPLTKWKSEARYETQKHCEDARVAKERIGSLDAPDDSWSSFYRAARCIERTRRTPEPAS